VRLWRVGSGERAGRPPPVIGRASQILKTGKIGTLLLWCKIAWSPTGRISFPSTYTGLKRRAIINGPSRTFVTDDWVVTRLRLFNCVNRIAFAFRLTSLRMTFTFGRNSGTERMERILRSKSGRGKPGGWATRPASFVNAPVLHVPR